MKAQGEALGIRAIKWKRALKGLRKRKTKNVRH
jgi:hypothetical protein